MFVGTILHTSPYMMLMATCLGFFSLNFPMLSTVNMHVPQDRDFLLGHYYKGKRTGSHHPKKIVLVEVNHPLSVMLRTRSVSDFRFLQILKCLSIF
jgi:hypothetical protein